MKKKTEKMHEKGMERVRRDNNKILKTKTKKENKEWLEGRTNDHLSANSILLFTIVLSVLLLKLMVFSQCQYI